MSKKHVVIAGTGRSGTTFLVELLTHLGLDTGFESHEVSSEKNNIANAGLEHDIREENAPYIVKAPGFCDYAEEVLSQEDIFIEHVIIPVRDLHQAAESRRQVYIHNVSNLPPLKRLSHQVRRILKPFGVSSTGFIGGLVKTDSLRKGKQEEVLLQQMHDLILAVSETETPITIMRYPRIVKDCAYLYKKLKPLLGEIDYDAFSAVFFKTVQKDLVHDYGK